MRYGSNRYRYGAGDRPETADAEFTGRVEYVGTEPAFRSGFVPATQQVGMTVTDVRRGGGVSVGDYVDVDVAVVDGGRHVVAGSMNPDVPALDQSMVQPGVLLVAWANVADGRWQAIDISTDGPASSGNYAGRSRGANRYSGAGYSTGRGYTYGRTYSRGLEDPLDLTDFPTNVFVVIPDAQAPTVPRQIRESDHTALERAWDCMMKGRGMIVEGSDTEPDGTVVDRSSQFRELLRGGLADSPLTRDLFREIACDDAHPITFHIRRNLPAVMVDAFQFDPTNADPTIAHPGHHTIDVADFDQLPRVSGNPRNHMYLRHQVLVHALREARQGVLFTGAGDPFPPSHTRAIADENLFRHEQGQTGDKGPTQPTQTITGAGTADWRWDFTHNGAVFCSETWHLAQDAAGSVNITSITYSP